MKTITIELTRDDLTALLNAVGLVKQSELDQPKKWLIARSSLYRQLARHA